MTYDLERLMPGATKVGTAAFASAIIENMSGAAVRHGSIDQVEVSFRNQEETEEDE